VSRPTQVFDEPLPVRGYHPLRPDFPDGSGSIRRSTGLVRVRSPLLAESRLISFPPGTEMFQFPGFAFGPYVFRTKYLRLMTRNPKPPGELSLGGRPRNSGHRRWVSPFGHPWIKACSQLPTAFRSVPRPSSPLSAKASTEYP
jgi:hypothetical protein